MERFHLLCLFSIFYVATTVVGIGVGNKLDDGTSWMSYWISALPKSVDDGKSWMWYWNSAMPKSPLPSKAVQQILYPAGERSYDGIGKDAVSISPRQRKSDFSRTNKACYGYYSGFREENNMEPGITTYFQGKDLMHLGKPMTLRFTKPSSNKAALLPRQVAKSIPFSSAKLPEILASFGVIPKSAIAETMRETIELCEAPVIKGEEEKYCATSLESLIDFTVSKLGKHVQVHASEVDNENKQDYNIEISRVQSIGDKFFVCHKENYAYGVFYCHKFSGTTTKAYMVPLVGVDGATKAKALAVCHTDTSGWDPRHLAFQVLKIKPGNTIPVCHFLTTTSILWVPM